MYEAATRTERKRGKKRLAWLGMLVLWGPGLVQALEERDYFRVEPLVQSSESIIGEPIVYPDDAKAQVTGMIVTLAPGESTGWHHHGVPSFAYMLEGEVTVDYEQAGTRTYRKGEAFLEAIHRSHNGRNTGTVPCRILVVFIGEEGKGNVVKEAGS